MKPRLFAATDALAWVAVDILRNRMTGYPAAIANNKLAPAEAEAGLRIAANLASQWLAAIDNSTLFGDSPYVADLRAHPLPTPLDRSARASHAERHRMLTAVRAHPRIASDPDYAELVDALLWWEEAGSRGELDREQLNALNAELRAAPTAREAA